MQLILPPKTLAAFNIPQCVDIGSSFPVNPNKPPWRKRRPEDVKWLVIHHSASTGTLEAENRYHVNNNNWRKLSYHLSIDRGQIVQINDLLDVTSHAMGANEHGIGICINWDLRLRELTDFERRAVYGIVLTLLDMFPGAEVVGHNEISLRLANHRTSCPVISMDKLRSEIMEAGLKLEVSETPNDMLAKSFAVNARTADLYRTASVPGRYQLEAQRKLAKMEAWMKQEGLM